MSRITSKIDDIHKLQFEPMPAKAVKVSKMVRIDRTTVALGENGTIYTNAVRARLCYTGSHDGALGRALDGCVKLGVLSAAAVRQHKQEQKARHDKLDAKWRAASVKEHAEALGLKLTPTQQARLDALSPNAELTGRGAEAPEAKNDGCSASG